MRKVFLEGMTIALALSLIAMPAIAAESEEEPEGPQTFRPIFSVDLVSSGGLWQGSQFDRFFQAQADLLSLQKFRFPVPSTLFSLLGGTASLQITQNWGGTLFYQTGTGLFESPITSEDGSRNGRWSMDILRNEVEVHAHYTFNPTWRALLGYRHVEYRTTGVTTVITGTTSATLTQSQEITDEMPRLGMDALSLGGNFRYPIWRSLQLDATLRYIPFATYILDIGHRFAFSYDVMATYPWERFTFYAGLNGQINAFKHPVTGDEMDLFHAGLLGANYKF